LLHLNSFYKAVDHAIFGFVLISILVIASDALIIDLLQIWIQARLWMAMLTHWLRILSNTYCRICWIQFLPYDFVIILRLNAPICSQSFKWWWAFIWAPHFLVVQYLFSFEVVQAISVIFETLSPMITLRSIIGVCEIWRGSELDIILAGDICLKIAFNVHMTSL